MTMVKRKHDENGGTSTMEPKTRKPRVSHGVPVMDDDVNAKELTFRPRGRTTKYSGVVDAIRALTKRNPTSQSLPGINFRPADGESVSALKLRLGSLVSRNCSPHAKAGTRFRVRETDDGRVCVFLDKKREDEPAEEPND